MPPFLKKVNPPGLLRNESPVPNNKLLYTFNAKFGLYVMALVRAEKSTVPTFQTASWLTLVMDTALSNTAVSCANGKLLTAGVPPELVAHAVAPQVLIPDRLQ